MPRVSVIMPAYNTAQYIGEAINSVLSQDYPNKELIIIDDGSTDGTVDIIRRYEPAVTLLTQKNQGSAVARNAGLDAARGDYVAFLDSDDIWLPGKLTAQVRYMEQHPEIGMSYGRWQVWKPQSDGEFSAPKVPCTDDQAGLVEDGSGWLYNRLLFTSLLHTITVIARRDLIDKVGRFDITLKRGQDYDYWLRASRITEIHQLDQILALYRLHGEGCVKKWPHVNYEKVVVENALSRWGLEGPTGEVTTKADMQRRLAGTCFSFGYHHYWEGSPRLAVQAFRQCLGYRPGYLAAWRYLMMSLVKSIVKPSGQGLPATNQQ
ncbi:glycosyltransferase [Thiohalophilus sp.]|uniref:glycosyltransferase n=1 Tax=Thiohalophilus sp. TaxID=3028392 RepID=UPI003A101379